MKNKIEFDLIMITSDANFKAVGYLTMMCAVTLILTAFEMLKIVNA